MNLLYDNHSRPLRYLRLGVTERCNLRCFYCMPEEGLPWQNKEQILSYEEMLRLTRILSEMGIDKVRITGGEPFVRKDLLPFMQKVIDLPCVNKLSITTNGTAPLSTITEMKRMGIHAVNLSLDTLDPKRFAKITRRDEFDKVWAYYQELLNQGITTKINAVVMENQNVDDILGLCQLTLKDKVSVRFIEEMPFNGGSKAYQAIRWNYKYILGHIQKTFPQLTKMVDHSSSTSYNYRVADAPGTIGVIPAYSRSICATCDRIRLTPKGELKTCLYQNGGFSMRDFMREGASDENIKDKFLFLFGRRTRNGFESEKQKDSGSAFESMATIGG